MKILIVKLSSIGDVVHTLPAAAIIKRALPNSSITWVVERRAAEILRGSPIIDRLVEIDTRLWRRRPFSRATVLDIKHRLAEIDPAAEVAIDFQGLIKSGLITFASRALRRVGFVDEELREPMSRVFLTEQVSTPGAKHVIEKNLALARAALPPSAEGLFASGYEFPIAVTSEDRAYVERVLRPAGNRAAIINPGGGWRTKLWPANRYSAIVDWLWSEYRVSSLVTYGPGEEQLAHEVARGAESGAATVLASTLKQFVALAREAALFVGGDTGPLHLAASAGTRIVGLYGPTAAERNGPFNPFDIVVGRDLWCRDRCHRRSCWHWECMEISVISVQQAIARRLGASVARHAEISRA